VQILLTRQEILPLRPSEEIVGSGFSEEGAPEDAGFLSNPPEEIL
jgi:hypothetical protein